MDSITPAYRNHSRLDITLDYDARRGNLTGQLAGEGVGQKNRRCSVHVQRHPPREAFRKPGRPIHARDQHHVVDYDRAEKSLRVLLICPPVPGGSEFGHGLIDQPVIEQLLRGLTTKADGSVDATREDASAPNNLVRVKLTLHRVQN